MERVWCALCDIPYGSTCSYKDIAAAVGNPKASRAVGMANNRNPLPIFIPCHRVIGVSGALVGYGGGLTIKIKLLEIEKQNL
jgi:methylated-DNA-[protein]-cysteine S-methyltransferase